MIDVDLVAFQFFKFTVWLETFMQVQLLFLEIGMSFQKLVAGGADALVAGALETVSRQGTPREGPGATESRVAGTGPSVGITLLAPDPLPAVFSND